MKFNLKKDVWGIIFSVGVGTVTYLIYKIGKAEGCIQTNEEINDFLNGLVKEIKSENAE